MKGIKWAIVLALLAFLGGGLIIWFLAPKEPSYQGRTLSSWLGDLSGIMYADRTTAAASAIRSMGSNSVPILLARLSERVSPKQRKFWQFARKFIPSEWNPVERNFLRKIAAAQAINILGTDAKAAFPTLTNLFWSGGEATSASIALAGSDEGVAVLLQAVTNQNWVLRYSAVHALGQAAGNLDAVIPALIEVAEAKCTNQQDYRVHDAAGFSLVRLRANTEVVVPVLLEFLKSPNPQTRMGGAVCLGMLSAHAKAAVPLLFKARSDADSEVREAAETALSEIDPKSYPPSTNAPGH